MATDDLTETLALIKNLSPEATFHPPNPPLLPFTNSLIKDAGVSNVGVALASLPRFSFFSTKNSYFDGNVLQLPGN